MLSNLNEYYESNLNKSNCPNKSYIFNNNINELKNSKKSLSNDIIKIPKAKSFSINNNNINDLAIKYNILNYDISYRVETFRITISDITENKIKDIYDNMKLSVLNKENKEENSDTKKEDPLLIENNYLDKYNMIKSFLG